MRFVIKTTDREGHIAWLIRANGQGFRSVGPLDQAALFDSEDEARLAIANMPAIFASLGLQFEAEPHRGSPPK
jgi:hypothetical protein